MDGIERKSIRIFLPAIADELVGREAMECLESFDEISEMNAQLLVVLNCQN